LFVAVGGLAALCALAEPLLAQTAPRIDFDQQIHPILAARCLACHSEEKRSGALSLATYSGVLDGGRSGAAIKPGNSAGSLLVRRIDGETQPVMPLGKEPLSAEEIGLIRAWIDQGARATPASQAARPKWEPPLALERPSIPAVVWKAWTQPLDRFVAAYLSAHKIPEPQLISDAVFARRAYLDVWGLLPAPEELKTFLADRTPDKRTKLVERLLADNEKYAENWVTFWNDLLRNDEGVGYAGSRKSITEWLLASLKSDLPYNQFVGKLLNPTAPADPEGFLIGVNWRGDISASQTPAMQAAQNSAQIFIGVNLKCNSCHDSFISKWKLKDAYALATYFSPDPKLQLFRCDAATGQYAEPGFLYPELNRPAPSASIEDRHATVASIFTDPRDGRLARTLVNRYWQRLLGRGLVEPVDEMDAEPWSPELLDWLASDFAEHNYDLKRLVGLIVSSRAYQMAAVARKGQQPHGYVFRGPEVRRVTAEEFADAIGSITGEWRVYQPDAAKAGVYTREWRDAASPLTRALGRPIRDQVVTTRNNEATTLQGLELVNGESLTHWLWRGARNMLGELPPEPASLFDSGTVRGAGKTQPTPVPFDVDISQSNKLWLVVQDTGSYEPDLVAPVWGQAELVGPAGAVALSSLKPVNESGLRTAPEPIEGVRAKAPSTLIYDIAGKGYTRLRGTVTIEQASLRDDVMPRVRFFVFDREPNMERLVPVAPQTPVEAARGPWTIATLTDRVFWYALGRAPSARERQVAEQALRDPSHPGQPSAAGLADLLWSVMMTPDFQLIY
jgi:hypothetical protein